MKKIILKSLFCFIFVFCIFTLANTCFCAAKAGEHIYFEKPDSWTGEKVFVDIFDSSDNTHLSAIPGNEMTKSIVKFQLADVFSIKGDIYSFEIPDITGKNYDKVVFSNENDNITIETTYEENTLYRVTEENGTSQTVQIYKPTLVDITKMSRYITTSKEINSELYNNNIQLFDKLYESLQTMMKILLGTPGSIDIFPEIIEPLSKYSDMIKKEEGIIDKLNKKIEEAKEIIKNDEYTKESIDKLVNDIAIAEKITENQDFFTNDQIKDIINTLTNDINNLVPDTTELEKLLEEAKKIDKENYTDETIKTLTNAITSIEDSLKDKTTLTVDKVKELIKKLSDAMNTLKENNILIQDTNPPTGDILYIVITVLVISVVIIAFTVIYSKKKKRIQ